MRIPALEIEVVNGLGAVTPSGAASPRPARRLGLERTIASPTPREGSSPGAWAARTTCRRRRRWRRPCARVDEDRARQRERRPHAAPRAGRRHRPRRAGRTGGRNLRHRPPHRRRRVRLVATRDDGARGVRRRGRDRAARRSELAGSASSPRRTSRRAAPASTAARGAATSVTSGGRSARRSTERSRLASPFRSATSIAFATRWPRRRQRSPSLSPACARALRPGSVSSHDHVLVVGPGPIGLIAAQVARALGGLVRARGWPAT